MSIGELLSWFFREDYRKLSRAESILLEGVIFVSVMEELFALFKDRDKEYRKLLKNELSEEDEIMDVNFLRHIVNDIVSTNEYTLEGIANVIRMPLDAVLEIVTGINTNPSLMLATKIIKLHSDVRREFYRALMKKIMMV
ncbi:MAG TPA: hypothetical protein VLJ15_07220 [Gammaproteobacteria bacterium]|nr:hypothetical protein [Gammaproteobacteria bacterium]